MTRYVKITAKAAELRSKMKGQEAEIMDYLTKTYGVEKNIDQNELVLALNAEQTSGKVLAKGSKGPISRLFEFYRSKNWAKNGAIVIIDDKPAKGPAKEAGKWKKIAAYADELEACVKAFADHCEENGLDYSEIKMPTKPVAEVATPVGGPVPEGAETLI